MVWKVEITKHKLKRKKTFDIVANMEMPRHAMKIAEHRPNCVELPCCRQKPEHVAPESVLQ